MRYDSLKIYQIIRPSNPHRKSWDEEAMRELTDSIRQLGLIEPIIVHPVEGGYRLDAGDRRLEACKRAGLSELPCMIREDADMMHGEAITWAENLAREDLPPMDQARQVHRMHHVGRLTLDVIARTTNRSLDWVRQRLQMMQLPEDVRDELEAQRVAVGAALALGRVSDDVHRRHLTRCVVSSGAAVPIVKEWVGEWERVTAAGGPGADALPLMPIDGQAYIVHVPCWLCHQPQPHDHMLIERVCRPCASRMQDAINAADADSAQQPREISCETNEHASNQAPN